MIQNHLQLSRKARVAYSWRDYLSNLTGFISNGSTVITADPANRTVALSGTVLAIYKGDIKEDLISGWVSPAHTNDTAKRYMLVYDGSSYNWKDLTSVTLDFSWLLIAYAFYDSSNSTWVYLRECHGTMDHHSHREMHKAIGTIKDAGGDLSSYVLNSTTAANRRPDTASTYLLDEDCSTTLPSHISKSYTRFSLTGSGTESFAKASSDIINLSTNNPYYNQLSGTWVQTLMPANSVATIWELSIPVTSDASSTAYAYWYIQPQWVTLAAGPSGTQINDAVSAEATRSISEVSMGAMANIIPESVGINKIIIAYTGGNWTIRRVDVLTGSRYQQSQMPAGNYLSAVSVDTNYFTGNGTVGSILSLAGTRTSGRILKANDNGLPIDSIIAETATGIGVGVVPAEKLDVAGNIKSSTSANNYLITQSTAGAAAQIIDGLAGTIQCAQTYYRAGSIDKMILRYDDSISAWQVRNTTKQLLGIYSTGDAVFNENGDDVDFRFEGDADPYLLVIKGNGTYKDRVGFGTNTPYVKLHAIGDIWARNSGNVEVTAASTTTQGMLKLKGVRTGVDEVIAAIYAYNKVEEYYVGGIEIRRDYSADNASRMRFVLTDGSTAFDAMAMYASGAIVINESGRTNGDLRVEGDTDENLFFTKSRDNRVAVGNNAPVEKFHVYNATTCKILIETNNGGTSSLKLMENTAGTLYGFEFLYDGVGDKLDLWTRNYAGGDGRRLSISKTGSVAIGDFEATEKLEVSGNIKTTGNIGIGIAPSSERLQISGSSAGYARIDNTTDALANIGGIKFFISGSETAKIEAERTVSSGRGSVLKFFTGNSTAITERMRITDGGAVGINTTDIRNTLTISKAPSASGTNIMIGELTDGTVKTTRIISTQYSDTAEPEGFMMMRSSASDANTNIVSIGGGSSTVNAATQIDFYTGATSSTATGTVKMTIDGSGRVILPSTGDIYLGAEATDGTWRIVRSGNDLAFQRRESGSYVTKSTITAA